MIKTIVKTVTATVFAMALMIATGDAQTIQLDLTNDNPPTTLAGEGDEYFAKLVKEKSKGRIDIKVHHGGSLGFRSKDNLDAVQDGAVPIANTFGGFLVGIHPIFALSSMPFITGNPKDAKITMEVAFPYINKYLGDYDQFLLYTAPFTPVGMWAKRPITSLESLAGLRVRTFDSFGTNMLKSAGAIPLQLSFGDIVPQLTTGGIDAVFTSAEGGAGIKLWEHVKYFTELNYTSALGLIHMNIKVFENLPADLQAVIKDAAKEANEYNWGKFEGRIESRRKIMRDKGMTIVTDIPEGFLQILRKSTESDLEKWRINMGSDGDEILAKIKSRR